MCTLVETPNVKILLDAGISVCPYRYNLMPHPLNFKPKQDYEKRLKKLQNKLK